MKLGKEREKMNQLRQKSREHSELKQHCQNLRRAIEEEKKRFTEKVVAGNKNSNSVAVNGGSDDSDPDALCKITRPELLVPPGGTNTLAPQQREYLKSLPPLNVLEARARAYKANEDMLRDMATKLHERSSELEGKFRRVVSLCTGVEEERIDSLLEGLVQAVESDPGEVDTARVSSFLRKVDESVGVC